MFLQISSRLSLTSSQVADGAGSATLWQNRQASLSLINWDWTCIFFRLCIELGSIASFLSGTPHSAHRIDVVLILLLKPRLLDNSRKGFY